MPGRKSRRRVRHSRWFHSRRSRSVLAVAGVGVVVLLLGAAVLARDGGEEVARARASDAPAGAPSGLSERERAAFRERGLTLVTPPAERAPAPPVRVQTASFGDGSLFDLESGRGNIVVLYFMAWWCFTCIPEAQVLADLHEQYGDAGVRILVLDVDRASNEQVLDEFRTTAGGGRHLWAIDEELSVARALNVQILDATVVIDREGRIAYRDGVPTPRETHLAVLEALLAEDGS